MIACGLEVLAPGKESTKLKRALAAIRRCKKNRRKETLDCTWGVVAALAVIGVGILSECPGQSQNRMRCLFCSCEVCARRYLLKVSFWSAHKEPRRHRIRN